MLQRFLPVFAMTFFIVLFIVLMQFLWRFVDDIVGKGLGMDVIGELFFYAALTMIPTALPLAVLLASIMTFGNLGESFELTAMKAAGVSLFRIMRPLLWLMLLIAVGAFFFQNDVLPVAQARMWTLMFSVRQKSPEVEIPEKSFYDKIPNMNMYVNHKNQETGTLYDIIIYDVTQGMDNSRVILADSARLNFTEDKTHLLLQLYSGEMFENLKGNAFGFGNSQFMPFRRENFTTKDVYFSFDMNLNRMDEQTMRNQYVGKNISQLQSSIDSLSRRVDSVGNAYAKQIRMTPMVGLTDYELVTTSGTHQRVTESTTGTLQAAARAKEVSQTDAAMAPESPGVYVSPMSYLDTINVVFDPMPALSGATTIDLDSVFRAPTPDREAQYTRGALEKVKRHKQEYEFRKTVLVELEKTMRRHDIEMQKKFTLSIACIIFFFIGAPLGAIIKKGGLGTPLVVSVLLFITYYLIDNTGYKMARDGKLEVWSGIWLSTAVLLPLGIFFTVKAANDSSVFNIDAYKLWLKKLMGKQPKRSLELKEVIMNDVIPDHARTLLESLSQALTGPTEKLRKTPRLFRKLTPVKLKAADEAMNHVVEYLSNTTDATVISLLNRYPFHITRRNIMQVNDVTEKLHELFPLEQDKNIESETTDFPLAHDTENS
ncbi:MAG: LptF/LptG family permease [Muribaculaceae bacterium]|nr:LptF/LptG family permease [Muribaculaceae bacterium]